MEGDICGGHILIGLYNQDIKKIKLFGYSEDLRKNTKVRLCVLSPLFPESIWWNEFIRPIDIGDDNIAVKIYPEYVHWRKWETCNVFLLRDKFKELLNKKWIGTRYGPNHLEILYNLV